jgi:hypothetical protein
MEVDNAGVGVPARHQATDGFVVERGIDLEEALELVARADVVPGKDMQPTRASRSRSPVAMARAASTIVRDLVALNP